MSLTGKKVVVVGGPSGIILRSLDFLGFAGNP